MKNRTYLASLAMVLALASNVQAASEVRGYAQLDLLDVVSQSGKIKYTEDGETESWTQKYKSNAIGFDVRGGAVIGDVRAELQISYTGGQMKDDDGEAGNKVSDLSYYINGYYDIKLDAPVTPYVKAGIGYKNFTIKGDEKDMKLNSLSYQAGLGVSYNIDKNVAVDLGYTYNQALEAKDGDVKSSQNENIVNLGARYTF
ncbi:MAG: hypothetical protein Ta2D_07960 [Rickettsiales bacterium]|nr:MAG: hypothetical protein Ta2D_07960 [Rickettsiales bacterium]